MRSAVEARGVAHVMFATGNSQLEFLDALVARTPDVPWPDTVVFHMDEYVGVGPDHPAGFQRYIRQRIVERALSPGGVLRRGTGRPRGRVPPLCRPSPGPSARSVLPGHRRERAPGLQRSPRRRFRRPPRRQGGRARCHLPAAAGQRGPLRRSGLRPDPRPDGDHSRPAAGRPGAGHRARGAKGRARPRRARPVRSRRRARRRRYAPSPTPPCTSSPHRRGSCRRSSRSCRSRRTSRSRRGPAPGILAEPRAFSARARGSALHYRGRHERRVRPL